MSFLETWAKPTTEIWFTVPQTTEGTEPPFTFPFRDAPEEGQLEGKTGIKWWEINCSFVFLTLLLASNFYSLVNFYPENLCLTRVCSCEGKAW